MSEKNIIGNLVLINSKIKGLDSEKNNFIFCDNTFGDVVLENSTISFNGSDSLLFIVGGNKESLKILATLNNETMIYIGRNTSFHKTATCHLATSEGTSIIIGEDCLISRDVWIRTGDAHPIYSTDNHVRVNESKNVIIGDHVWVGQDVAILKGAKVGSGSILGSNTLCTKKYYFSNTSYGGLPARQISPEGSVFFDKTDINNANKEQLLAISEYHSDEFIYTYNRETLILDKVDKFLDENKNPIDRIEFFKNISTNKNRFAISSKLLSDNETNHTILLIDLL